MVMDYLKYLLVSVLSVVLIFAGINFFGAGIGIFAFIGATAGYMIRYKPPAHAISYVLWLLSFHFWHLYSKSALAELATQDPQKYTPDKYDFNMGILIFMGAVIFHPVCYGIGKLTMFLWGKSLKLRKPQDNAN